jgi:hypothetical protein
MRYSELNEFPESAVSSFIINSTLNVPGTGLLHRNK